MMQCNQAGLKIIAQFEGLRLKSYQDVKGVWTIGYGHTGKLKGKPLSAGMSITSTEASQLLMRDLCVVESYLSEDVGYALNENQFSALCSFCYNVGVLAYSRGSIPVAIAHKRLDDVPAIIKRYVYVGGKKYKGLVARREAEAELWLRKNA